MSKRLLSELRRRRVPQVAGFYLAAGWAAFEVAEGAFPRLGLPDWTITFVLVLLLLAFPLVVGLAWFYDIGPDGVHRTPASDATPAREPEAATSGDGGQSPGSDAREPAPGPAVDAAFSRIAVTGAVLVLALTGGAFVLFGGSEPEVEVAPDAMAVLPFTVRGGEEVAVLADGMVELLSAKLDGAGELRSADPHAVLSRVDGGVEAARGREIARRLGAGHYVLGSVLEFGGELRLQAAIYRTDDAVGAPIAEASVEGAATGFLELVDELATELLVASEMAPPGRLPRIAALTTEDLDALRYFLEGERALRETRYADAVPLFERAVEADSAFALAYYRMSVAASWLERAALRERAMRSAIQHRDRLGERDRALVQAWVAHKEGRHTEAEDRYRDILASYPDDLEAWYELGEVLLHRGAMLGVPLGEVKPAFRQTLALDPGHGAALFHLSNLAAWDRDLALVDSATRALRAETGTGDTGPSLETQYAFIMEDSAGIERALAVIRGADNVAPAVFAAWSAKDGDALRRIRDAADSLARSIPALADWVAHEMAGRGLRDEALEWLESVEMEATGAPVRTTALAVMPFLRTPPAELERLRAALEAWDPGPVRADRPGADDWGSHGWFLPHLRIYLMALVDVRLDRSGEALRLAARLPELGGIPEVQTLAEDMALHVRAQVALEEGQPGEALRIIDQSAFWDVMPWDERSSAVLYQAGPVGLKVDALMELRRYREAIRWHSVLGFTSDRGYSHYRRAQAYEAVGEPDRAAEHYAEFLRLWEGADRDLGDRVRDARSRLQALTGEGRESW